MSAQFRILRSVRFPPFSGLQCNMMPFRMGDKSSLPKKISDLYWEIISACPLPKEELGKIGYLTVSESFVPKGSSQRRPGIHVEKHVASPWGGGNWGGGDKNGSGLYMASSIGNTCRVWDCCVEKPGHMGDCEHLKAQLKKPIYLQANQLVWLTDSCPHEALPQAESGQRQFFRLVTSHVGLWYKDHSTPNPLVDLPESVKVIEGNKFESS